MKIVIEEPWINYRGQNTIALSLNKKEQYTISEFIFLLEKAKEKFGDKVILFHEMNSNSIGGFSRVYLNPCYDLRKEYGEEYYEDDTVCIYG